MARYKKETKMTEPKTERNALNDEVTSLTIEMVSRDRLLYQKNIMEEPVEHMEFVVDGVSDPAAAAIVIAHRLSRSKKILASMPAVVVKAIKSLTHDLTSLFCTVSVDTYANKSRETNRKF